MKQIKYKSDCCKAKVRVECGDDGDIGKNVMAMGVTCYHVCTKCEKACTGIVYPKKAP